MENNNELINQLISNQTSDSNSSPVLKENEGQVLITTSRVVSIRYKIYVVVLLAVLLLFGYNYLQPAYDQYLATNQNLTNINTEIGNFDMKKKQYEADTKLITTISQQENQIVSCLDYQIGCAQLDKTIQDNFGIARSYIQLNNLSAPKMAIDEKKILANIDQYLIKKTSNDPNVVSRSKNGYINSISIGDPVPSVGILQEVPIRLNITFSDKDALLSFIDNVEKNILEDPNYRILYKLDEVSYDIVNYTNEQQVDVLLHAYYTN